MHITGITLEQMVLQNIEESLAGRACFRVPAARWGVFS